MAEQKAGDPAQGSSSGTLGLEMQQVPEVDTPPSLLAITELSSSLPGT